MADYLRAKGLMVKKIVIQRMWDAPVDIDLTKVPKFRKRLNWQVRQNQGIMLGPIIKISIFWAGLTMRVHWLMHLERAEVLVCSGMTIQYGQNI